MLTRVPWVAVGVLMIGGGCTRSPGTAPAPTPGKPAPAVKVEFPRGAAGSLLSVDQPIPSGTPVEYIVPIDESIADRANLQQIYFDVQAINKFRTHMQTGSLRRAESKDGAVLFKGIVTVHQHGPATVTIEDPDGGLLAQYDAQYK